VAVVVHWLSDGTTLPGKGAKVVCLLTWPFGCLRPKWLGREGYALRRCGQQIAGTAAPLQEHSELANEQV
jgi:hypothetical protein